MQMTALTPAIKDKVNAVLDEFHALIAERDRLREELAKTIVQPTDSDIAKVLQAALDNVPGWRVYARKVLGQETQIACRNCGALFPSGGKRRFNCGNCNL